MTTNLESTYVVQQLSFSMFPSTLAFDFYLMLGSFLTFWALMGSTTVLVFTHVVEQLSFSIFPSTLAFDFDLMSG